MYMCVIPAGFYTGTAWARAVTRLGAVPFMCTYACLTSADEGSSYAFRKLATVRHTRVMFSSM